MRQGVVKQRAGTRAQEPGIVVLPKVWAVSAKRAGRRCEGRAQGLEPLRLEKSLIDARTLQHEAPDPQAEAGKNKAHATGELAFYRKYTEAMVRRYGAMSMGSGRVPSLMGREMFRGKVTSCRVRGFDDVVIFCHDVETRIKRLNAEDQQLIKRVALQGYAVAEAAGMLGMSAGGCARLYARAVDRLTAQLLEAKLMNPAICCQEGSEPPNAVSN